MNIIDFMQSTPVAYCKSYACLKENHPDVDDKTAYTGEYKIRKGTLDELRILVKNKTDNWKDTDRCNVCGNYLFFQRERNQNGTINNDSERREYLNFATEACCQQ